MREVSDVIGHDWRNLARELGVTESDVRFIECHYPDQRSAARQALELFRTRDIDDDYIRLIVVALKGVRRHNLVTRVKEMVVMYGCDIRF